jgi:hypothetical protein
MNIAHTIIPKSDRTNADDLLAGPRTIKIVSVGEGPAEGPVALHYEGENGRPYLPCKSMRRVLVTLWGAEGSAYVGKRLTLFCDPSVKFGGEEVGGIRISHADIPQAMEILLTATRGKKKRFRVEPLPPEKAQTPPRALDELVAAGDAISATGEEAYRTWWTKGITSAERELLGGPNGKLHQQWKKVSAPAA